MKRLHSPQDAAQWLRTQVRGVLHTDSRRVGAGDGFNAQLAWAYVALRIVHSLVQATVNKVMIRFLLFALSSFVLIMLVAHTVMAAFAH